MSPRRSDAPESLLCCFTFQDGRRCALPVHPDYDSLCYSHGTLARRASRQDNLRHILEPLAAGRSSVKARRRALRGLTRAMAAGRLSPEQTRMLMQISLLIEQSARFADQESFTAKSGPAWTRLRQAVDDLDAYRSTKKR